MTAPAVTPNNESCSSGFARQLKEGSQGAPAAVAGDTPADASTSPGQEKSSNPRDPRPSTTSFNRKALLSSRSLSDMLSFVRQSSSSSGGAITRRITSKGQTWDERLGDADERDQAEHFFARSHKPAAQIVLSLFGMRKNVWAGGRRLSCGGGNSSVTHAIYHTAWRVPCAGVRTT